MAWLKCTEEGESINREQQIINSGGEAIFPECDAVFLAGYLFQIGPIEKGAPLSFSEIAAWQGCTGVELTEWECSTIRRLSLDFLNEVSQTERGREAPYTTEDKMKHDREVLAAQIKDSIRSKLRLRS